MEPTCVVEIVHFKIIIKKMIPPKYSLVSAMLPGH